ncbi:replicative DNA helicase [Heyndrickxia camelliae]|uniref:SF4 helicase domain-containing protein n=1 Tax=Heyndrickxia camelliae TaxID=1707093 RepID=A0A2N3LG47_9BACI|nr:replicative DNA helicase [Heyndrickxia camelliae]PKR83524.1 hypothetical protein CWO92_18335 [Heyndrickxia camelliae]
MAEDIRDNFDLATEALLVGAIYSKPILYVDYSELIKSKYDFYDEDVRFLYDMFALYYQTFSQEINESKITIFMQQEQERFKQFKSIGGWKTIERSMELSDPSDIKKYFDIVKKYSLVREFERKGFPIQKVLQHPKFTQMKAEDIVRSMRFNVDNINTVIGGGKSSVILGKKFSNKLTQWRESPDMGATIPFDMWNKYFRGLRKKKVLVDGMLSNEGKSRRMAKVVNFMGVLNQIPILVLVNEQDEDEWYAMQASTICNNYEFNFLNKEKKSGLIDIREADILMGNYQSEEDFRFISETVGDWIAARSKIFFLELNKYSDEDLEREIKKHVLGLGVQYVFYDTLKGYKTDQWETVKQTTTHIKNICNEMNIGAYVTIQLTDETHFIDIFDLTSNNIANAKQLYHVVDHMVLEKRLAPKDYGKYMIKNEWGEYPLDINKTYYGQKIAKNRGEGKGSVLVTEVDLDRNKWIEKGFLIKS